MSFKTGPYGGKCDADVFREYPWSFVAPFELRFSLCLLMLLSVAMASFVAQLIMVHCAFQPSINKCWPGWL